jgi:hypothetical protein
MSQVIGNQDSLSVYLTLVRDCLQWLLIKIILSKERKEERKRNYGSRSQWQMEMAEKKTNWVQNERKIKFTTLREGKTLISGLKGM